MDKYYLSIFRATLIILCGTSIFSQTLVFYAHTALKNVNYAYSLVKNQVEDPNLDLENLGYYHQADRTTLLPEVLVTEALSQKLLAFQKANNLTDRISHLCRSLSLLGEASIKYPLRASYLVSWANIRSLLGTHDCQLKYTEGNFLEALRRAIDLDPYNTRVAFLAAETYALSGMRSKSDKMIKKILSVKPVLLKNERTVVGSHILNSSNILDVLPAGPRQVAYWTSYLYEKHRNFFYARQKQIETLQLSAIVQLEQDLASRPEEINGELQEIYLLNDVLSSGNVRKKMDLLLAKIYENMQNPATSSYLQRRATYENLSINVGATYNDIHPGNSSLTDWNSIQKIYLDSDFQSIGFQLMPGTNKPEMIELVFKSSKTNSFDALIKFYGSMDNYNWRELPHTSRISFFNIGNQKVISFNPPKGNYLYLKINYQNSGHANFFSNDLFSMYKVYG